MKIKKSLLLLILSFCLLINSVFAASSFDPAYTKTAMTYIQELKQVQNQVFTLAQNTTFSTPESKAKFNAQFNAVRNNLHEVTASIYQFSDSLPPNSPEKTNTLLLINAVNFIGSALNELYRLNQTDSTVEKMLTLENYFRFRIEATDTLNLISNLLV